MMIAEGERERLKKVNVDKGLTTWITHWSRNLFCARIRKWNEKPKKSVQLETLGIFIVYIQAFYANTIISSLCLKLKMFNTL